MKQEKSRVLAYRLAKEINHGELEDISGGSPSSSCMTTRMTLMPGGPDMTYDTLPDY